LHKVININEAQSIENPIYIDMRSPSEYQRGHIPYSVNIPLFTDKERAIVGTIYKTVGVEEAKQKGLEIVSAKLPDTISQIRSLYQTGRRVIVYCWRGGMRSKSVVTVLNLMGIQAFQLLGGYKAFRNYVLSQLANFKLNPEIIVLCGSTGVGKTHLLTMLANKNQPVIDLEKLANHRGSAFGQIGLGQPATAQNFDALLLQELQSLNDQPYIIVECESKRIGNVYIPDVLYKAMQTGKRILVYANIEVRISRLIEEYTDLYNQNSDAIMASIRVLHKRIGMKKTAQLLSDFSEGKLRDCVYTLLVDYYDPLYGYEKSNYANYNYVVNANNLEKASEEIIEYLQTRR